MSAPQVSFVLATHNRKDVLAHTLRKVAECGLGQGEYETIVVDNASTDGTTEVARDYASCVLTLRENRGSCAKAFGVDIARGEYIVFLDDDSFPRAGAVEWMIAHFNREPKLGAAGFVVVLPDGRREGGALPHIFVGCGVGFRAKALREVGGLDRTFFMQAEEYDLAFRLAQAGWHTRVFGDLVVDHLKSSQARRNDRTAYYDTRNNLRVIYRYMPECMLDVVRDDCLQRYRWLSEIDSHEDAFVRGVSDGMALGEGERNQLTRWRLSGAVFEHFFRWQHINEKMGTLARKGVCKIILADLGKNVFPFVDGARRAGIEVLAIADDRFAKVGREYRGVQVVPVREALALNAIDRIVISNTAHVQANATQQRLIQQVDIAIENLFPEVISPDLAAIDSTRTAHLADEHGRNLLAQCR